MKTGELTQTHDIWTPIKTLLHVVQFHKIFTSHRKMLTIPSGRIASKSDVFDRRHEAELEFPENG